LKKNKNKDQLLKHALEHEHKLGREKKKKKQIPLLFIQQF